MMPKIKQRKYEGGVEFCNHLFVFYTTYTQPYYLKKGISEPRQKDFQNFDFARDISHSKAVNYAIRQPTYVGTALSKDQITLYASHFCQQHLPHTEPNAMEALDFFSSKSG